MTIKGGAIYFEPGITLNQIPSQDDPHKCFYYPWSESTSSSNAVTYINFTNNSASSVGNHIYGASLNQCKIESDHQIYNSYITPDNLTSLVSSDPLRVCICRNNSNGQIVTQCDKDNTYIQLLAYPGERLDISVAVVGWDYEMANGMVYLSTDSETEQETSS